MDRLKKVLSGLRSQGMIIAPPENDRGDRKVKNLTDVDASRSGHYLNSILLTFQNQGSVYKSAFSANAQPRFASVVVDSVLGPPRLARQTWQCPCMSVVHKATHEVS